MKKKVLALTVLALIAGSANAAEIYNKDGNKLDLYGKVKGEHDFTDHANSDATYARLGFKGETQIADGVTGFGQFEHQFNASQPEGSQTEKTRLAFAGLDLGDYGSIDYGRNYGIVYDVAAYTDNLTEFGGDSFAATDNYLNGRTTGVLTYRNKNFFGLVDGLALGLQYQGANERKNALQSNGEGFGTSLQYDIADSGASVSAAYAHSKATDGVDIDGYRVANGDDAEIWAVGTKYDANGLYLATTYSEGHNINPISVSSSAPYWKGRVNPKAENVIAFADKSKAFETMAAYTFDFGLQPTIGYVEAKNTYDAIGTVTAVKYVQLGAAYHFNKNFSVDAAYKINLVRNELAQYGIDTKDSAVLGATYQF